MEPHKIVSHDEWLAARQAFLKEEKDFTRARDALSAARRALPWEKLDKDYTFDSSAGPVSLADLFDGRTQLIVYHFMFGPEWEEGCPSCSYLADHFDGAIPHLNHRDVSFAVVSRAAPAKIEAYKKRMGWRFPWVSSERNDFNFDYHVSFTPEDKKRDRGYYNYRDDAYEHDELPGLSVFARDDVGAIYHTYSSYARGLDTLVGTYNFLDLVPKGRDEDGLPWPMAWVRRHDRYDT